MRGWTIGWLVMGTTVGCVPTTGTDPSGGSETGSGDSADSADTADTAIDPATWCEANGFGASIPWSEGPYGAGRHEIAEDFSFDQDDGTSFNFKASWTGCENYVFIPDTAFRTVSDRESIWTKDLDDLLAGSPKNTHYLFIPNTGGATRDANVAAIRAQIDKELGKMSAEDAAWWKARLHVAPGGTSGLDGWLKDVLRTGIGNDGLGIDRYQTIRGLGSFADDTRSDSANTGWPFQNNLAFAAHESRYFNMEATRQAALDAEVDPTVIQLWNGEVIAEYADMEAELPSAEEMATFDTFEIDIDMRCPDHDAQEQGNCGAWDYIAAFYVEDDSGNWIELSRFITSYHRETHWVADATPMMAHLLQGGKRNFRWSWAPSWNTQPTETRVSMRFSDQGKGYKPRTATLVATGGSFGATYNDGRVPVDVPISASAKKVELWAVTSGHGADTDQCSEFCNHQHEFTIDGATHLQEFTMAGTATGCIDQIEEQMVPNQSGTWWYGRGGWCPGEIVHPYAVDVTSEVGTDGTATVGYRGLYDDATPDGARGSIVLNAWLVEYD